MAVEDLDSLGIDMDDEIPTWDFPDIDLGDGRVTRVLWMASGEADAYLEIVKTSPLLSGKAVEVVAVKSFPSQLRHDYDKGTLKKIAELKLEALTLTGPISAVDDATDLIVGVQKSIPQIDVGIRVVEVLENDSFSFGIDTRWSSVENTDGPTATFFNTAATVLGLPEIPGRGGSFSPGSLQAPLLVDLGTVTDGIQVDFLIRALKLFAKTDLLSAPHIAVLDGYGAELIAGEEIPFFTPQFDSSGFRSVTTDFKRVGIRLFVTPKVVGRDLIRLNVTTTVDAVTGESTFTSDELSITNPVITIRQATTLMDVNDGDTAVIGGLFTRQKFNNENRVPVVGEIPILNILFSSRSKQTVQSNLIFFITPKILDPSRGRRRLITPVAPAGR